MGIRFLERGANGAQDMWMVLASDSATARMRPLCYNLTDGYNCMAWRILKCTTLFLFPLSFLPSFSPYLSLSLPSLVSGSFFYFCFLFHCFPFGFCLAVALLLPTLEEFSEAFCTHFDFRSSLVKKAR